VPKGDRKRTKRTKQVDTKAKWQDVVVLAVVKKEGRAELTPGQYLHVTDLIKQLVGFGQRKFETLLRIEQFHDFWELKDKGGVLGKKNIRVYFAIDDDANEVIILHFANKKNEGSPPRHLKVKLKNRLRLYKKQELEKGMTRYCRNEDSSVAGR